MRTLIYISFLLIFMNSCIIWEEDCHELLDSVKYDNIDSIYISVGKMVNIEGKIETVYKDIIDTTIVPYSSNSIITREFKALVGLLSSNTYVADKSKRNYRDEYFKKVHSWNNRYNVKQVVYNDLTDLNNDYELVFDLYFYSHHNDYNRFEIMMNRNGHSYTFCCKDNGAFPFNTLRGLSKYPREWVFEDTAKVQFVNLVNGLLKGVVKDKNHIEFVSM